MRLRAVSSLPPWQGQVLKNCRAGNRRALGQAASIYDSIQEIQPCAGQLSACLACSAFCRPALGQCAGEDYAVLIISRERLEVPTNCEIGVYIQDQLSARCSRSKALRSICRRAMSLRLKLLPGQAPGCHPGMLAPPAQNITLGPGTC
jgi:hypothetical protein